ncbi:MAG: two-component regulator propeller domain-containing protein [Chitinophagaceae bacterium]
MKKIFITIILSLLCNISFLKAQNLPTSFDHYNIIDGLPDNNINAITQDKYGFIWIGTSNGLARFDGKNFTEFSGAKNIAPLPSNEILSIKRFNINELLIVTRMGVTIIDVSIMKSSNLNIPPRSGELRHQVNKTRDVLICEDGGFIVITWSGFYHFNKNKELIFRYDDYKTSESNNRGFGVFYLKLNKEQIVVAGQQRVLLYNITSHTVVNALESNKSFLVLEAIKQFTNHRQFHVLQLKNGEFIVLPYHENYLVYIDEIRQTQIKIYVPGKEIKDRFTWRSTAFRMNDSNILLTGKFNGLYLLKNITQTGKNKLDTLSLFNDSKCNVFYKDSDHKIWMGLSTGLRKEKESPINLQLHPGASLYEPDVNRSPLIQTAASNKYLYAAAARSGGIYRYHKTTLAFDTKIPLNFPPHSNKSLFAAEYWCGDTLLFGTDYGLILYSEKRNRSELVSLPNWDIKHNWVADIYLDNNKNIWITCNKSGGSYFWKYGDKQPVWFEFGGNIPNHLTEIFHITQSPDGNFWLAGNGVARYNVAAKKIDYSKDKFTDDETKNNSVTSIVVDSKGSLWLANGSTGLVNFHPQKNKIKIFTKKEGLCDYEVSGIHYQSETIWVICKNGIQKLDMAAQKFVTMANLSDFYFKPIFANKLSYQPATQSYYTGSASSIVRFESGYKALNARKPRLILVYAKMGNDSVIWFPAKPLSVNWTNKNITLFVNAINFVDAKSQRYAYRVINGNSTSWINLDDQRSIILNGLTTGKATIEIKVYSPHNSWPDQTIKYEILVRPPYWQTWWFIALCTICTLGVLYSIILYKKNQREKILLIKENISRDLHDEIGATLSGISMYSHMVKSHLVSNQQESAIASSEIIQSSAAEMTSKLNDIVWLIKPANESLEIIAEKIKSFALNICSIKNIKFQMKLHKQATTIKLPLVVRKNIFLICKEAINNAVKYSNASFLNVEFFLKRNELHTIITDNGIGFDLSNSKKGNGLENIQKRVSEMSGQIHIKTSHNHGCNIHLINKITQKGII